MSVKYNLVERGNPQKPDDPKKFYAQAIGDGEVSQRDLSKEIEEMTALSEPDVVAALSAFRKILQRKLAEGRIVRLGEFGSFQVALSSEGAVTADKFNPSTISDVKIVFRPGTELKELLKTLKFEKI
jgi:predicted histone-like DNA-binding protein